MFWRGVFKGEWVCFRVRSVLGCMMGVFRVCRVCIRVSGGVLG